MVGEGGEGRGHNHVLDIFFMPLVAINAAVATRHISLSLCYVTKLTARGTTKAGISKDSAAAGPFGKATAYCQTERRRPRHSPDSAG